MTVPPSLGRAVRGQRPPAPLPFWAWCAVSVFCFVLYTVSVPLTSDQYQLNVAIAFTIATVGCGSIVLSIFRPLLGAALQLMSALALALATRDSAGEPWPLPVTGLISLGALILLLGIRERWIVSLTVWWVSVVLLVTVIATSPGRYAFPDQWGQNLTIYASYTATVLAAAIAIGQRRRIRADLAEARRDVELEHAERRYVEERARIARELHDVVAHSMSLIHMQALSAPYRLAEAPRSAVDEEFGAIAVSARTALAEMRQLLGALRSSNDDAELVPQPQLSDINELADATSRAGIPIDVDLDGRADDVSPIVQLTTYRIVQEALSNVVRHAPGAPTKVTTKLAQTSLRVSVQNDPPRNRSDSPISSPDSGGQGLRGMRERVFLVGGQLRTQPTPDGGYLVDASLPITTHHRPEISWPPAS